MDNSAAVPFISLFPHRVADGSSLTVPGGISVFFDVSRESRRLGTIGPTDMAKGIFGDGRSPLPQNAHVSLTEAVTWIGFGDARNDEYIAEKISEYAKANLQDWGDSEGPPWLLSHLELLALGKRWETTSQLSGLDLAMALARLEEAKQWLRDQDLEAGEARETRPDYTEVVMWRDDVLKLAKRSTTDHEASIKAAQQGRKPSEARAERWYQKRVDEWNPARFPPSEHDDVLAAKHSLPGISRERIRKLRRSFAPQDWKKRGRPKKIRGE
jgi:hypothetical protein